MDAEIRSLLATLDAYLDGIYEGDAEKLRRVLHKRARLFCPTDAEFLEFDLPSYLEVVRNRPSPASRGDARYDEVQGVEVASATTAHARVRCAYLPKLFTDDLTLVRNADAWQIVTKVWHYTLVADCREGLVGR